MAGDGPKDYEIGYRKPPVATRFKIGNNANPRGRPRGSTNLAAMLRHALDAPAVNPDGRRRRRPTKRELMIRSLVERSAGADLAATKLLFELLRKADPQAVAAEPATIGARGEDALTLLKERLAKLARAQAADPRRAGRIRSAARCRRPARSRQRSRARRSTERRVTAGTPAPKFHGQRCLQYPY